MSVIRSSGVSAIQGFSTEAEKCTFFRMSITLHAEGLAPHVENLAPHAEKHVEKFAPHKIFWVWWTMSRWYIVSSLLIWQNTAQKVQQSNCSSR